MTGPDEAPAPREPVPHCVRETISEALRDPDERARMGIDTGDEDPLPVMIEINIGYSGGLERARARLMELFATVCPESDVPLPVSGPLYKGWLTIQQSRDLVLADAEEPDRRRRAIYRIWPDFPLRTLRAG